MCHNRRHRFRKCRSSVRGASVRRRKQGRHAGASHLRSRQVLAARWGARSWRGGGLKFLEFLRDRKEFPPWPLRLASASKFFPFRRVAKAKAPWCPCSVSTFRLNFTVSRTQNSITDGTLMKIHEYQAKAILARYGGTIPRGEVAYRKEEGRGTAQRLKSNIVV